jgi:hypothetical protein
VLFTNGDTAGCSWIVTGANPVPARERSRRFREILGALGSTRVDSAPSTRSAVSLGEIPGWLVLVERGVRRPPYQERAPVSGFSLFVSPAISNAQTARSA